MHQQLIAILLITALNSSKLVQTLNNGLALRPPMGWMHWQRYRCEINCAKYPRECVSEQLFKTAANRMVQDGYLAAGYEYLIVDDCWSAKERDPNGRLQSDPHRFPSGIKALSDYVHSLGLKFGLYADYGTFTCAGYPGSLHHMQVDAETFAEWAVDYVKLDGCYADVNSMERGYAEFGRHLNATGRPMVFSCSWPAYQETTGQQANYTATTEVCNLWRNYGDIQDSLHSMNAIVSWFADNQDRLAAHSSPGHWNDPDMLLIGNFGLSVEQSKAQMTVWCILGAPLIMSVDLERIDNASKTILLNAHAISINQDALGRQGKRVAILDDIHVWTKQILPHGSFAVGFVSHRDDGTLYEINAQRDFLGLTNPRGYLVLDVFSGQQWTMDTFGLRVRVAPTGGVLLKATAL